MTPVNDAPTLATPADVALSGDQVEFVELTGIGAGPFEPSQHLTVQASSSDPSIIANPEVVYYSPDGSAELQLSPVAGASGSASITVTVRDDGGIANGGQDALTRTFTVTTAPQLAASSLLSSTEQTGAAAALALPKPALSIRMEAGLIVLSWDGAAGPYVLQRSANAGQGDEWATVTREPEPVGGTTVRVALQPQGPAEFFRLAGE